MRFVHELEVLIDDGAEELEVRLEEAGELLDDVHEAAGDDRLVVLGGLGGHESQQVHDGGHEESPLLRLAQHAAESSDGPDEWLQRVTEGLSRLLLHLERREREKDDLQVQRVHENGFRDLIVQRRQQHETLPHALIQRDAVSVT